jgi:hypothetical protein
MLSKQFENRVRPRKWEGREDMRREMPAKLWFQSFERETDGLEDRCR